MMPSVTSGNPTTVPGLATRASRPSADDHDGRNSTIPARRLNRIDTAAPDVGGCRIDGRVVDDDDDHVAVALHAYR
jgi:hypothetical protein